MQETLIKNLLRELARNISGKNSETIVDILKEKTVNEFKIADKMKLTVNQVRNIFYKLQSYDVVIASRKKDKRKGWYIYSWSINVPKSLEVLRNIKQKQIFDIEHNIKSRESKRFYLCTGCNIEMTEESALSHNFFCPECGRLLQLSPPEGYLREQRQKLEHAKKEIAIIDAELGKMNVKKMAKRARKDKKEKKAKKEKRRRERKKKAKLFKKSIKKSSKKGKAKKSKKKKR
ncbi:hypothetical protein COS75_00685 [Candidatus Pacearchaeota archaeon CG06_land_8_20_14_3_00_35_12]|nr:MAG: hypothetical protein COS75_00685 [Candidatus Pacearchaeota archaeon CG06_land_8_20_14_3_00_35_12]